MSRLGEVRQVRSGLDRYGAVMRGAFWLGELRQGKVRQARLVKVRHGMVMWGWEWRGRRGLVRRGAVIWGK